MAKFRGVKSRRKFASVHAATHNHVNQDRRINRRGIFRRSRAAAPAERRQIVA